MISRKKDLVSRAIRPLEGMVTVRQGKIRYLRFMTLPVSIIPGKPELGNQPKVVENTSIKFKPIQKLGAEAKASDRVMVN
jgi:hypothetical protein